MIDFAKLYSLPERKEWLRARSKEICTRIGLSPTDQIVHVDVDSRFFIGLLPGVKPQYFSVPMTDEDVETEKRFLKLVDKD